MTSYITKISIDPYCSFNLASPSVTLPLSATSILIMQASPPCSSISVKTSCNLSVLLAARPNFTPFSARAFAIPLPIPLDAPVISVTFPDKESTPGDIVQ